MDIKTFHTAQELDNNIYITEQDIKKIKRAIEISKAVDRIFVNFDKESRLVLKIKSSLIIAALEADLADFEKELSNLQYRFNQI